MFFQLLLLMLFLCCLKKNLNASRPSEYPPVWGQKMPKRLFSRCGIIDCKDKLFLTFSVLVINSINILYYTVVAHPAAHGLLSREKVNKERKPGSPPPPLYIVDMYLRCFLAAPIMNFITPYQSYVHFLKQVVAGISRRCACMRKLCNQCCSLEALTVHTICSRQVRRVLCVQHPERRRLVLIAPLHTYIYEV